MQICQSAGIPDGVVNFLPGVGEIRKAEQACEGVDADVLPLHGSLSLAEQERADCPLAHVAGVAIRVSQCLAPIRGGRLGCGGTCVY